MSSSSDSLVDLSASSTAYIDSLESGVTGPGTALLVPLLDDSHDSDSSSLPKVSPSSSSSSSTSAPPPSESSLRALFLSDNPGAAYCLTVTTLINLLNYADRYVPSAVKASFQKDLDLSDTETSVPLTAFIIVYMATSPIFSHFAEHGWSRKKLMAGGIVFWSAATASAALSWNFWSFLLFRSLVGVGEAAYATIAPALISDYYPPHQRNKALSVFYLAIPIGAAMGYAIGGTLGQLFSWRIAFVGCGIPGILMAVSCLFIKEPPRGMKDLPVETSVETHNDVVAEGLERQGSNVNAVLRSPSLPTSRSGTILPPSASVLREPVPGWKDSLVSFAHNKVYVYCTLGLAAVTFAAGAMADWAPDYLQTYYGMSEDLSGQLIGAATVIAGIGGTMLGAWAGDRAKGILRNPYLGVTALAMGVASAFAWMLLFMPNAYVVCSILGFSQIFLWVYTGPINSLTANCVPANLRTRAFAIQIFFQHALGDAISPTVVGGVSDIVGSLRIAMIMVPATLSLGFVIWLVGWRTLEDEKMVTKAILTAATIGEETEEEVDGDVVGDPYVGHSFMQNNNVDIMSVGSLPTVTVPSSSSMVPISSPTEVRPIRSPSSSTSSNSSTASSPNVESSMSVDPSPSPPKPESLKMSNFSNSNSRGVVSDRVAGTVNGDL